LLLEDKQATNNNDVTSLVVLCTCKH